MLKTRPDISKKSKSCNLDPPSRGTEIRAQQVEAENANTKILQQNKGRLLSSRAHTARTRAGSRGEVHGSITFLAACSSSTPSPTTTYTTFLPNLCIMRSKQLSFPAKTQIKKKKTQGGEVGDGGRSHGQRGQSFGKSMFTWLAACSSSFPSPTTTYVMLVPKRETIRSKQLSLPGDKQMGFDRFLGKQKYKRSWKRQ